MVHEFHNKIKPKGEPRSRPLGICYHGWKSVVIYTPFDPVKIIKEEPKDEVQYQQEQVPIHNVWRSQSTPNPENLKNYRFSSPSHDPTKFSHGQAWFGHGGKAPHGSRPAVRRKIMSCPFQFPIVYPFRETWVRSTMVTYKLIQNRDLSLNQVSMNEYNLNQR